MQVEPTEVETRAHLPWVCQLELGPGGGVSSLAAADEANTHLRALVRLHGQPLGYLSAPMSEAADLDRLRERALGVYRQAVAEHLSAEGLESAAGGVPAPSEACPSGPVQSSGTVTVAVCTRNRTDQLQGCLDHLAQLRYPDLEILVVDNAPVDDSTSRLTQRYAAVDARFRYVREDRPGLSYARNRALEEATGRLLAFTDDDVWVDGGWVDGLVRGFQTSPRVGCVTGLVATASVGSPEEAYFDARAASWSSRLAAQLFDPADPPADDPLFPFSAGRFGTGANFCFDRELMRELGGFDVHLGAGTATRGGEDLDAFVRVLRNGRSIRYEPSAVVWHHHRADSAALLGQMYSYGTGLSAFLVKCLLDADMRRDVLQRVPIGLLRILRISRETGGRLPAGVPAPRGALTREFAGYAAGVPLYLRARRHPGRP